MAAGTWSRLGFLLQGSSKPGRSRNKCDRPTLAFQARHCAPCQDSHAFAYTASDPSAGAVSLLFMSPAGPGDQGTGLVCPSLAQR